jgi:hypothetical protein
MAYRRFTDEQGHVWEAWEVHPASVERRINGERRLERRATPDRRWHREFRFSMPPELRAGWLTVQGNVQKVRVVPIPRGWMKLSDQELVALVRRESKQPHHRWRR